MMPMLRFLVTVALIEVVRLTPTAGHAWDERNVKALEGNRLVGQRNDALLRGLSREASSMSEPEDYVAAGLDIPTALAASDRLPPPGRGCLWVIAILLILGVLLFVSRL